MNRDLLRLLLIFFLAWLLVLFGNAHAAGAAGARMPAVHRGAG